MFAIHGHNPALINLKLNTLTDNHTEGVMAQLVFQDVMSSIPTHTHTFVVGVCLLFFFVIALPEYMRLIIKPGNAGYQCVLVLSELNKRAKVQSHTPSIA